MVTQIIKINDVVVCSLKMNTTMIIEIMSAMIAKQTDPAMVFLLLKRGTDKCPHLLPPNSAIVSAMVKRLTGR